MPLIYSNAECIYVDENNNPVFKIWNIVMKENPGKVLFPHSSVFVNWRTIHMKWYGEFWNNLIKF